jgi:hypothetical protein
MPSYANLLYTNGAMTPSANGKADRIQPANGTLNFLELHGYPGSFLISVAHIIVPISQSEVLIC